MPQIIIEHDIPLNETVLTRLKETLKRVCARFFSTDELKLEPADFGFKFDFIRSPSESTHNVVVRIVLHNFHERTQRAKNHAPLLRNAVLLVLDEHGYGSRFSRVTVGVSLVLAQVEWCAGTIDDVP